MAAALKCQIRLVAVAVLLLDSHGSEILDRELLTLELQCFQFLNAMKNVLERSKARAEREQEQKTTKQKTNKPQKKKQKKKTNKKNKNKKQTNKQTNK